MSIYDSRVVAWWEELQEDAGAAARLRRAPTPFEVGMEAATINLMRRYGKPLGLLDRVAVVAGVLSVVRDNIADVRVAKQIASGERPIVSIQRFKRLLVATEPEDCMRQFRRLVRMVDNRTNVADLADAVFNWTDDDKQWRRRRWIYDYYGGDEPMNEGD